MLELQEIPGVNYTPWNDTKISHPLDGQVVLTAYHLKGGWWIATRRYNSYSAQYLDPLTADHRTPPEYWLSIPSLPDV